jgi:hypothetical protein
MFNQTVSPVNRRAILAMLVFLALLVESSSAARYGVGPGQSHSEVDEVPWESLLPGDEVEIHWRKEPYRSKWVICRRGTEEQPIVVRGYPGPGGQLPVIDGRGATTRKELNFWHEARGVIRIGGANRPKDLMPAHIVIERLDIRGARPPYSFTGRQGELSYSKNAAAIFVSKGEQITIRGCTLRDSGNGLLVSAESSEILIEKCWIHDNGIEGSAYEHNSYTAAAGITFQFNRYGPLRAGCRGNNLKDRSAGTVIRHNWIEGGNRQLDLVDVEDSQRLRSDPRYQSAYVYGNVLIEPDGTDNNQIVHFGGDSGKLDWYRPGILHFFNNTVVSRRKSTTTLFKLSSGRERVDCRNNLIYVTGPGRNLSILAKDGTVFLNKNWFKQGWVMRRGERPAGDSKSNLAGSGPGFVDLSANDFRLRAGASAVRAGSVLDPRRFAEHSLGAVYGPHQSSRARKMTADDVPHIGALEVIGELP